MKPAQFSNRRERSVASSPRKAENRPSRRKVAPISSTNSATKEKWWQVKNNRFIAAGVLLALAVGVFLFWPTEEPEAKAQGEVFLQPSELPGTNAFGPSVAQPPPVPVNPAPVAAGSGGVATTSGAQAGLYGGVRNVPSCNGVSLASFLEGNPLKARPWSIAAGVNQADIRAFIATLTPALLRVDNRVTEFGFRNGRAIPRQAVLQTGTAVLLDRTSTPKVRCASGNPLDEPRAVASGTDYRGPRWPAFSPTTLVVIRPSAPTTIIILNDIATGVLFGRLPGSIVIIDIDRPAPGAPLLIFQPGQTGNVTGGNWPPGTPLTITFDAPPVQLATTTADGAGNFAVQVTIPPEAAPGTHQLTITGGGFTVNQPLYVIPRGVRAI